MKILLAPFVWVINLITENPAKTIIITLGCIFFNFAGTLKSNTYEKTVIKEEKVNGKWVYFYEDSDGDLEMFTDYEKQNLEGKNKNKYRWSEYHAGNVFLHTGWIVCAIIVIVMLISEDGKWDFDDVFEKTTLNFVRCEIEDGQYVYTIFDRLLTKSSYQTSNFTLSSIRSILILPKYKTRSKTRSEKLDELGIQ
jgi:hypothetical protein